MHDRRFDKRVMKGASRKLFPAAAKSVMSTIKSARLMKNRVGGKERRSMAASLIKRYRTSK